MIITGNMVSTFQWTAKMDLTCTPRKILKAADWSNINGVLCTFYLGSYEKISYIKHLRTWGKFPKKKIQENITLHEEYFKSWILHNRSSSPICFNAVLVFPFWMQNNIWPLSTHRKPKTTSPFWQPITLQKAYRRILTCLHCLPPTL